MIVFYSNYSSRIQPAIFCTIRAIIVFFPRDHQFYCQKVMKYAVPTSFLIPLLLVSYMIPQVGFCTQLAPPFEFGQVGITIDMKGPINELVHLTISMICMSITVTSNIATLFKIRHIIFVRRAIRPNQKSYRAEFSLSATMLSLLVPFTTDVIYAIVSITRQSVLGYVLSIRPFALDFATVIVAWIFYLTHPLFRKRNTAGISSLSTGRMVHASDKSTTH
uniref:Serpentine Receptor, class T n=1 Tax=Caenorhabditis tropicalis TaxID=1561998 RepID=A0A1I7TLN6_9PELO